MLGLNSWLRFGLHLCLAPRSRIAFVSGSKYNHPDPCSNRQLEEEERKLQIEVLDKKKKNIRARTYKDQSPATHGETPKSPARHNETPKSPAKPKTPKNKGPLSPKKKETHPKKHRTKHPSDLFANDNDNHVTHAIEI